MARGSSYRRVRVGPSEPPLPRRVGLQERFRTYLITGLLVVGPVCLTFYLIFLFVNFIDGVVAGLFPDSYNPNHYLPFHIPGLGLIVAVALLTLIGALAAGYFGRLVVRLSEYILGRMPFIRGIYGATKQIFETVLAKQSNTFREVVLVEFPRREMWTIGFVTGQVEGEIQDVMGGGNLGMLLTTRAYQRYLLSAGKDKWELVTMIYAGDDAKLVERVKPSLKKGGLFVLEYFSAEADTVKYGAGGWPAGALAKLFADGFEIVRDEVVEDVSDWGLQKRKLVRFVAKRK